MQGEHLGKVHDFNAAMFVETGFILALVKDKNFLEDGVMKMPERWQKAVEQNSEYVV